MLWCILLELEALVEEEENLTQEEMLKQLWGFLKFLIKNMMSLISRDIIRGRRFKESRRDL